MRVFYRCRLSVQVYHLLVYGTGDSLQQIGSEIALRQDRPVFSSHLKVIVIAADLLRTYSLKELLYSKSQAKFFNFMAAPASS